MIRSADVFCRVVDNLGDAGVCWRLCSQLAVVHQLDVRLWIDRPNTLNAFVLGEREEKALIDSGRIQILALDAARIQPQPADWVIETFGCDVPLRFAEVMTQRSPPSLWYNLEYLSAEDWVEGCHALPSPHPTLPITRWFFFPGFTPQTGGLLREPGLLERRRAFQNPASPILPISPLIDSGSSAKAAHEVSTTHEASTTHEVSTAHAAQLDSSEHSNHVQKNPAPVRLIKVGMFCYDHALLDALLDAFEHSQQELGLKIECSVFQGPAQERIQNWRALHPHHLTQFTFLPWLSQSQFDEVLWGSDFNVVRGEDSFVRAQWAGRPFLWDIYPTQDEAHLVKMAAFLRRYREGWDKTRPAEILGTLWQAWVRREPQPVQHAWLCLLESLAQLNEHAEAWCDRLSRQIDLAQALIDHARARVS